MGIPIILSFSTCFIFAIAAIFVWWLSVRKNKNDHNFDFFGWSWFCAAGIVGFMGLRTLFFGLGFVIWDLVFALVDQIFLVAFLVVTSYYVFNKFWPNRKLSVHITRFFILPLSLLVLVFIFLFMWQFTATINPTEIDDVRAEIIEQRQVSDWGSEFVTPAIAMYIVTAIMSLLLLLLSFDLIRNLLKNKEKIDWFGLLTTLSLIIFLIVLALDQRGTDAGWKLLLYRLIGMAGAMLAYLAISAKFNKRLYNN